MNLYNLLFVFCLFDSFIGLNGFYSTNSNKKVSNLYMRKTNSISSSSNLYNPKSVNQQNLVKYLDDSTSKIVISLGPAGTGKTLFSCQKAITELKSEKINKIVITRPAVTVEEEIGFLPGNIVKKMDPWTKPIFDIFLEYYSKSELDLMISSGKIEICPLAFMRGRTFKNSFILADEMQNSSPVQMKMLVTRIGTNSKLIITGDLNQTDILKENGLYDFVSKVERYNNTKMINIVRFDNSDVERSEIVKKVIEIYNYIKPINKNTDTMSYKTTSNYKPHESSGVENKNNKSDDAALIPKHHITHNFDIFFESRDF